MFKIVKDRSNIAINKGTKIRKQDLVFSKGNSLVVIGTTKDGRSQYEFKYISNAIDFNEFWCSLNNQNNVISFTISQFYADMLENFNLDDCNFKIVGNEYIYYPFHVLYRIDDLTDGKFYIGMCEVESRWNNGYMGSGLKWTRHMESHKDHKYTRVIIESNFNEPKELREAEYNEIKKYCVDGIVDQSTGCMNIQLRMQGQIYNKQDSICKECGAIRGHKATCSHDKKCTECGYSLRSHMHAPTCSQYKELKKNNNICEECGGKSNNHKKGCSRYKNHKKCELCGCAKGHYKDCIKYKIKVCEECGSTRSHKTWCSNYKRPEPCSECGSLYVHKRTCSKHKKTNECPECGAKRGHTRDCSFYNSEFTCNECGGVQGKHKVYCSKAIKCSECGCANGKHFSYCSKAVLCDECGANLGLHFKTCSKYKPNNIIAKPCQECGGKMGKHKKSCSNYKEQRYKKNKC